MLLLGTRGLQMLISSYKEVASHGCVEDHNCILIFLLVDFADLTMNGVESWHNSLQWIDQL
jgi:hypothetical protein